VAGQKIKTIEELFISLNIATPVEYLGAILNCAKTNEVFIKSRNGKPAHCENLIITYLLPNSF